MALLEPGASDRRGRRGHQGICAALLLPEQLPRGVVGDVLRLTLVHNPGAAFGLSLGPHSRWIFTALTLAALVVLWRLYCATPSGERLRPLALGWSSAARSGT